MARSILAAITVLALSSPALADDGGERHELELALGGGLSWQSADPDELDLDIGGVLNGRVMVDLGHARFDARAMMLDPTTPELFEVRGDARVLFVTVHDLTWRRTSAGELFRLFAGLGGEIDLPDDVAHLMLNLGFAMTRHGGFDQLERPLTEAYGGYAGASLRLHIGEVRDELRVAAHAMMVPPELDLELALAPETIFDGLVGGATVSNRLYVQVLREGVISAGPELFLSFEQLVDGPVFQGTLGISGTLGL